MMLAREGRRLPALDAAVRSGRIGSSVAQLIARVARPSTVAAWIERARQRTYKHLREEIEVVELSARLFGGRGPLRPPDPEVLEELWRVERDTLSGASLRALIGRLADAPHAEAVVAVVSGVEAARWAGVAADDAVPEHSRQLANGGSLDEDVCAPCADFSAPTESSQMFGTLGDDARSILADAERPSGLALVARMLRAPREDAEDTLLDAEVGVFPSSTGASQMFGTSADNSADDGCVDAIHSKASAALPTPTRDGFVDAVLSTAPTFVEALRSAPSAALACASAARPRTCGGSSGGRRSSSSRGASAASRGRSAWRVFGRHFGHGGESVLSDNCFCRSVRRTHGASLELGIQLPMTVEQLHPAVRRRAIWLRDADAWIAEMEALGAALRRLVTFLKTTGYRFAEPRRALTAPTAADRKALARLEKHLPLPPVLATFWRTAGAVDLRGHHPDWARATDLHAKGAREPVWLADPLVIAPAAHVIADALEEHDDAPLALHLAPDALGKAGYSSGMLTIWLPADAEDPSLEGANETLLAHLRRALAWAGFPGFASVDERPEAWLAAARAAMT
ncbi:MAG: hypothetical protein KF901_11660 [Myxococcales bacterium]|nr:hypothetical protein [Myxococcales bacterium]